MKATRLVPLLMAVLGCTQKCGGGSATKPQTVEKAAGGQRGHADVPPIPDSLSATDRLSFDQLSASFQTILGEPWTVNTPDGSRVPIRDMASALGMADYYTRVYENYEPHLLFAKLV